MQPSPAKKETSSWAILGAILLLVALFLSYSAYTRPSEAPVTATDLTEADVEIASAPASCGTFTGARVTLNVPRSGVIVVSATVELRISHQFNQRDSVRVFVAANETECDNLPSRIDRSTAFHVVFEDQPTSYYAISLQFHRQYRVNGPQTYSYYVRGVMMLGWDSSDDFRSASLLAVFYPS